MSIEKGIEFGNMWIEMNEDAKDTNTYAFFQMAIKALKQQSTVDKIVSEIDQKIEEERFARLVGTL